MVQLLLGRPAHNRMEIELDKHTPTWGGLSSLPVS
jgi:hypothetical protein